MLPLAWKTRLLGRVTGSGLDTARRAYHRLARAAASEWQPDGSPRTMVLEPSARRQIS